MTLVSGYIVVKADGEHEVVAEPMKLDDVLFIKEVLEQVGNKVYIGSEVKVLKTKKANSKIVDSKSTIILKAS